TAMEPYIDTLTVAGNFVRNQLQLSSSPEFAMKKIFAAELVENSTATGIYEIAPVFRDDLQDQRHLLEFTLLEWYRRNSTLTEILQDAAQLTNVIGASLGYTIYPHLKYYTITKLFASVG